MPDPTDAPDPLLTGKRPKSMGLMITLFVFVGFLVLAAITLGAVSVPIKTDGARLLLNGLAIALFFLALVGLLRLAAYRSPTNTPTQTGNKKSPPP